MAKNTAKRIHAHQLDRIIDAGTIRFKKPKKTRPKIERPQKEWEGDEE